MNLCRHLEWKGRGGGAIPEDQLQAVFEANEVPYSCLASMREWGPDDGPATPELCGPHRRCFVQSAVIRRG